MWARHKLGRLLAKVERGKGARGDLTSGPLVPTFKTYIKKIGLGEKPAKEAQRIAAMPRPELEAAGCWRRSSAGRARAAI